MSLQFKPPSNRNRNLKYIGLGGLALIGSSYLILSTFPHLKTSIYNYINGISGEVEEDNQEEREKEQEENESPHKSKKSAKFSTENEPIELHDSTDSLRNSKKLYESLDQSIVDINEWSNDNLKSWLQEKLIFQRILIMITLYPLLSQFRRVLSNYNLLIFNFSLSQILMALIMAIRKYLLD
ncbi:uncharacterized protein RJT21DRAFT_33096 [Scheffersomyces amazonensis]|uniref:uncharacterized protein n=1 Tax=Scheffersomyces amazonensis TaxID=1078765 RepID=UPI00315D74CA